jgi:isoleucyl-tRNA synthetase
MQSLIKQQLNVKDIVFEKIPVTYKVKPNYRMLGKAFGQQTADVLTLLKDAAKEQEVAAAISAEKEEFTIDSFEFTKDMFDVEVIPTEGATVILFDEGKLELDTQLTPELEAEGFSREVTRRLQNLRKTSGLEKGDAITAQIVLGDLPEALLDFKDQIMQTCGAKELLAVTEVSFKEVSEEKVKGKSFTLALEKNS